MIKKEYFPTQEVPAWVKERVMQKIHAGSPVVSGGRKFRLFYLIKYKLLVPIAVLLLIAFGGYLYFNEGKKILITGVNLSGDVPTYTTGEALPTDIDNELYTQNTVSELTTNDVSVTDNSDDLLQQKLIEAELVLNDLSLYANQEEDISL